MTMTNLIPLGMCASSRLKTLPDGREGDTVRSSISNTDSTH